MMEEHDDIVPAAGEYRSMLHMLSLTKTVPRGGNWSRSLELLREARGMDHRLTEISYNTGEPMHECAPVFGIMDETCSLLYVRIHFVPSYFF